MKKILVVGFGNMGSAMAKRWVAAFECLITAVNPSPRAPHDKISFFSDIEQVSDERYDAVLIAIKPQGFQVLAKSTKLNAIVAKSGMVISIMAGVSMSTLESVYPSSAIVKMMPNLPIAIGRGVSSVLVNASGRLLLSEQVSKLLSCFGTLVWLSSEEKFTAFSAVFGSGCGYIFYIIQCYIKVAEEFELDGLPGSLKDVVLDSVLGTVEYAIQNHELEMSEMVSKVESKGGTTKAGLDNMRGLNGSFNSMEELLRKTMHSSIARSIELGKEQGK